MKRRTFVTGLGTLALSNAVMRGETASLLSGMRNGFALDAATKSATLRPFQVKLPAHLETLPFGSDHVGSSPAFSIRGIKGWGWSPEQYLAEIPVMVKYRLNFLMNCYSSLWELGPHGAWETWRSMNFWYRPISPERKTAYEEVIRVCQQNDVTFCFSVNPNLKSDRPFDYNSAEDLNALWQHYAWAQSLGVKWFNVSLDDISHKIDASGHARLLNTMLQRLRAYNPEAQLVFCPTWYAGTGVSGIENQSTLGGGETPGVLYTRALAKELHPDVYLFWSGPDVCALTISADQARSYKQLCGHRIVIWDNYPVNDQQPALHLGPLTGRSADLYSVVDGYIANPMGYQNEANRIPMLTMADYLWDPKQYDPARSIGQSVAHLGDTEAKREVLRDLVELYPGRLWDDSKLTKWNSLRARFDQHLQRGERGEARNLLAKAQATLRQMKAMFSDAWSSGTEVLEGDVKAMASQLGEK